MFSQAKRFIVAAAILSSFALVGCGHEHHDDYDGRPAGYYDRSYHHDHDWDRDRVDHDHYDHDRY